MRKILGLTFLGVLTFGLAACDKTETVPPGGNDFGSDKEQYVVMFSSGNSGYLMQVDDITSGSIDGTQNANNRQQVTGNRDYVQIGYNALYNINYASQSSNGTSTLSTSWRLNAGNQLVPGADLDLSGDIKARGVWKQYIIAASSLSKGDPKETYERVKIVDTTNDLVVNNDGFVNTNAGEYSALIPDEHVSFSDIASYGEYILVGLKTKNSTEKSTQTKYERNTYLAVYSYDGNKNADLKLENLIVRESTDDKRAGQLGGNNRSRTETGIEPVDNGDIYLFCQGINTPDADRALPPSAVLRISGKNIVNGKPVGIDEDYYVNIQAKADNHRVWRSYYMGGTTFCLQLYTEPGDDTSTASTKLKFALFDAATQTFRWVEGVPATISDVSLPVLMEKEKGRVVFAVTTTDQNPALYIIDKKGKMTRGLEVKAETIEGVAKLAYHE